MTDKIFYAAATIPSFLQPGIVGSQFDHAATWHTLTKWQVLHQRIGKYRLQPLIRPYSIWSANLPHLGIRPVHFLVDYDYPK